MRGFFPIGNHSPHFLKMKLTFFIIELNSNKKRSEPHLKDGFVTEEWKEFFYEIASL